MVIIIICFLYTLQVPANNDIPEDFAQLFQHICDFDMNSNKLSSPSGASMCFANNVVLILSNMFLIQHALFE